ncbi:MAG TPA: energy transducer TonB [Rhodanobacter sp.]|nr:energy transducer TonB [Rhodanobacter sp.]
MKALYRPLSRLLLLVLALGFAAPVLAQTTRIDPQNLYRYWILLNTKVQMDAPNSGLNLDKPGCVAVTYTVGADGVPLDVQVARVVPKSDLGSMARSAVANFRYGPSLNNKDHQPVATYYIVPFNSPKDADAQKQLMAPCKLPGYVN